jgi:hypothetical protein
MASEDFDVSGCFGFAFEEEEVQTSVSAVPVVASGLEIPTGIENRCKQMLILSEMYRRT